MTIRISLFSILTLLLLFGNVQAQDDPIHLANPSFEDMPRASKAPRGWMDCGFEGESAPDTQPSDDPFNPIFGNSLRAIDGNTYLGLVVRDNDTWERVAQRLSTPLKKGQCYEMSMNLARAKNYISLSRRTNQEENYNEPVKIRIYGGDGYCNKKQLLGESRLIKSYSWEKFELSFEAKQDYSYLVIEAFYKTPALILYNGNIQVDNISPIVHVKCNEDDPSFKMEPIVTFTDPGKSGLKVNDAFYQIKALTEHVSSKSNLTFLVNGKRETRMTYNPGKGTFSSGIRLKKGTNTISLEGKNRDGIAKDVLTIIYDPKATADELIVVTPPPPPPVDPEPDPIEEKPIEYGTTPKILPKLANVDDLVEGQDIKIDRLFFQADSSSLGKDSYPVLDEIYYFLKQNTEVVVEIGGHTNDRCEEDFCRKLSKARAQAVADYLTRKGIPYSRLEVKGYGSQKPLVSNRSYDGRRKNQRVQIKILSLNG